VINKIKMNEEIEEVSSSYILKSKWCVHYALKIRISFEAWFEATIIEVIQHVQNHFPSINGGPEISMMKNGEIINGSEIYAISEIFKKNIKVKCIDSCFNFIDETEYTCSDDHADDIVMLKHKEKFIYSEKKHQ
jgi:hypothetical protein